MCNIPTVTTINQRLLTACRFRFEILQCGDIEKLIRRRTDSSQDPVYFAHLDEVYDIVKRAHTATGHGGRDKMVKVLSKKYANVTQEVIELYKSYCVECAKKRKRRAVKGVVVRPLLTTNYGSRGQVDLIDMQSMPNGQYKWILVYQDHLTKYCILRPITSKRAAEVAFQLMDIFLLFGSPQILQSDNGSEFTASVITELKLLWPDLLMVHGKPRHPQSQGSVERLNCDVKDMLVAWLGENDCTDWPIGLKFVQFATNTSYHSGIKQSPYLALFGIEPRVGLRSTALPSEILERMVSEDDLIAAFNQRAEQADASTIEDVIPSTFQSTASTEAPIPSSSGSTVTTEEVVPSATGFTHTPTLTIDELSRSLSGSSSATEEAISATSSEMRLERIKGQRKRARDS